MLHRVLCHVPEPALMLAEAHRVLRSGGALAVFDGDCTTITLATGPHDPLQACVGAFLDGCVHDPLGIADRGAQALQAVGRIGPELATALRAEACRRVEAGRFFGAISYASLTARKAES